MFSISTGDAVVRLEAGARATISQTTFINNEVSTSKPDSAAAGPIMGLYAGLGRQGSAAWFQDCKFEGSLGRISGEVAVEDRSCRVYSNTAQPRVWDHEPGRSLGSWYLTQTDPAPGTQLSRPDVFADVDSNPRFAFLRPTDDFFVRILREEAISTKLPIGGLTPLPEGTDFVVNDPYTSSAAPRTSKNVGLIAGLSSGGALCVLTALLAGWFVYFRKRSTSDTGDKVPPLAPTASIVASTLATNSHWATELSATYMGTMCQPDVPPPDPDAPATKKLKFLHTQLNGFANDAVILGRFTLLGPNQRRQGGAQPPLLFLAQKSVTETDSFLFHSKGTATLNGCRDRGTTSVDAGWPHRVSGGL